jgi:glyoxylase-like metal-dependent hydrolase (beta-lactamase superfamily II)
MVKQFASAGDTAAKTISFDEIGKGLYAFTAEGDPNSGVIVGDDSVMVIDAQATPAAAKEVIDRIRTVTDKPINHVVLSHYHAVRVLGASAYHAQQIIASEKCRSMIAERGAEDWQSEQQRMPRLFKQPEQIPGLTWPTTTFQERMTVYLGKRRVDLIHLGRSHTAGDIVAWVPDAQVMFAGDGAEYKSACYCGDAHFTDWPATLKRMAAFDPLALVPGRGAALTSREKVQEGLALTGQFLQDHYKVAEAAASRGAPLKEAFQATREICDPKYKSYAIYEHCLPFNVARAYDEALGIDTPRVWTAERDLAMWSELQG